LQIPTIKVASERKSTTEHGLSTKNQGKMKNFSMTPYNLLLRKIFRLQVFGSS